MPTARVAIVTGAAGDIGNVIALRLADDGLHVVVNDLPSHSTELDDIVKAIIQKGRKSFSVTGDVSIEEDVKSMVDRTATELGSVDVMVSNVGIFKAASIDQMEQEVWDRIFSINVRGMMFCYKWAAKQMVKQGKGGKLIGSCSVAGLTASPFCSAYSASKFAVRGLTQTAAIEYAKDGITANAYAPGAIGGTHMLYDLYDFTESNSGVSKREFEQQILSTIKIGHFGRPEDVAGLVSFLASKDSAYITGQTFSCDGGMHIA